LKTKHIPLRSCASCGGKFPKRDLTRIVRTPEGHVGLDATGKAAGRGTYLCASQQCWEQGLRKNRLNHVLRSPLTEPDKLALVAHYEKQFKPALIGES